jgi:probable rRNA maturation factor
VKVSISNRQRKIRLNLRRIEKDSLKTLRLLGLQRAELSILFASHQRTRALNLRYRGVDSSTDVLAFPIYESTREFPKDSDFLLGDIVINPSRAKAQAMEHGLALGDEIRWLMVHGLLHLLGYEHEGSAYRRRKMREKERELLEGLDW